MTGILKRREENTEKCKEKSCEDKGRDWSDASASQGTQRISGGH